MPQLVLLIVLLGAAAAAKVTAGGSVCQFELFELPVDGIVATHVGFDSRDAPLATFSMGDAAVSVHSFLYQNYTRAWVNGRELLSPIGEQTFLVRFAPPMTGLWRWIVKDASGHTIDQGQLQAVACKGAGDGFVRASASGPLVP